MISLDYKPKAARRRKGNAPINELIEFCEPDAEPSLTVGLLTSSYLLANRQQRIRHWFYGRLRIHRPVEGIGSVAIYACHARTNLAGFASANESSYDSRVVT